MKNVKFKSVVKMILFLVCHTIASQNDKIKAQNEMGESYFSAEINFISDAVFMGRKDSIAAPYLYPSIEYHHKSGFYTEGSFSYLTKENQSRIDLALISLGFDFKIDKLFGDISVTKYFFNEESYNVISEVEADITASLIYDLDVINVALTASTYFNNNSGSDFFLSTNLSHDFITANHRLQFSPTVSIGFGSQNFYQAYYINNSLGGGNGSSSSGNGSSSGNPPNVNTTISFQENEEFNLMAIEFSLPMWYTHNSFTFLFLPIYVIPQSEAQILIDDILIEEQQKNTFYWAMGLNYKF